MHVRCGAGLNAPVRPVTHKEQQGNREDLDRLNLAPDCEVAGNDGLSHQGEPVAEVIEEDELEEPLAQGTCEKGPKV